jgi:hypothetical protein
VYVCGGSGQHRGADGVSSVTAYADTILSFLSRKATSHSPGKTHVHMQKNEIGPLSYTSNNSKQIKDQIT